MSFPFVSCEDKLSNDDNKNSAEGQGEESIYRNFQDSVIIYRDGKINSKRCYYYNSDGKSLGSLILLYGNDGNLTLKQESTYNYSDDNNNYSIYTNNNGFQADQKTEYYYSSGDNNSHSRRNYIFYNDQWLLTQEYNIERNNNISIQTSVSYAMFNGEMIVISRGESKTTLNALSGYTSESEIVNFQRVFTYDRNDPSRFVVENMGDGSWEKTLRSCDDKGRELFVQTLESNDSVIWNETNRTEHKYDSQGNEVERIVKGNGSNYKYIWKYNDSSNPFKEVRFVYSDIEGDYIPEDSTTFYYSADDVLASVEINRTTNSIVLPITSMGMISSNNNNLNGGRIGSNTGTSGAKCIITCDSNGNPVNETLYKLDSYGKLNEFASVTCSFEFDPNNNLLGYVVKELDNDKWEETGKMNKTLDSDGNELSRYEYSKSCNHYTLLNNSYTVTQVSEVRSESRYNEMGFISFVSQSSTSNSHYVYSDGRVQDLNLNSKQETYYSARKVK